jgi:diguanylate cyclase
MIPAPNGRILVIDDNPDIHRDFTKILGGTDGVTGAATVLDDLEAALFGGGASAVTPAASQFELTHCYQGEDGFRALREANARDQRFVAAFVDMRMPPGWDGLQTIREIRKIDTETTIVVCTAYSDHSWHEIAAEAGALDRLLILKKPFDPIELEQLARALRERDALLQRARMRTDELEAIVRVRTSELNAARERDRLRMSELESAVQQRTAELAKSALTDRLTGLPNRAMLCDRTTALLKHTGAEAIPFTMLFIDFDRFKVINDSLGHHYGDRLLVNISQRLTHALRSSDTIARANDITSIATRLGGDEFCILLERVDDTAVAKAIADRLLAVLSMPYDLDGHPVTCTPSIGITTSSLGYRTAEEMLRDADIAMYRAKHQGRAQCVVFDRSMHDDAIRRQKLEHALPGVVERGELHAFYQPIVSLTDGSVRGCETLLRWDHPEFGWVSPADFIPLAEETREILAIGEWVLRAACGQLAAWQREFGEASPYVSVNASRIQLGHGSFIDQLRRVMTEIPFRPERLVIEVTETALMDNPAAAERTLVAVRDLGVKVYLDDFGAGFSSLANVQRFALNGMKLDRCFLDLKSANRRAAAVIHSTMTLARDLEMDLIAEGVESLEQVALLQAIGCESAQGYLFARPSPAAEIPVGGHLRRHLAA